MIKRTVTTNEDNNNDLITKIIAAQNTIDTLTTDMDKIIYIKAEPKNNK